ncbi:hypothetical protein CAPTEDRAFT_195253 [Capitella teleta]|uniref:Tudor domain-containing protein n=1 Tax=Capitella teleta TaxID=283909 RepID=R7TWL6_CAPTE|nr:hypothetical protein CAPTEDRAFT_195253 [Capitella teleta]|eukprot:ELT95806.1 hypothetical protein CAPTEDRAFT_195253 [Capitella teleta]
MAQAVDTLVKYRKKIVIPKDNKFLFPTPSHGGLGHLRGTDTLRKWSLEIQAEMPHLLRSTRLRKQIATVSQIANLQKNELDLLAGFLGHDIRIHRNFYRLPDEALQVARISKLLIAAQDGNVQIMGKTLEEIEVTPDDEVGGTESSSEFQVEEGTDLEDKVKSLKKQKRKRVKKSERPCARKAWSADEKAAVKRHFSKYYYINELPGKAAIEAAMQIEKDLINRTWRNRSIQFLSYLDKHHCEYSACQPILPQKSGKFNKRETHFTWSYVMANYMYGKRMLEASLRQNVPSKSDPMMISQEHTLEWDKGDVCEALWPPSRSWHKATIISLLSDEAIRVRYHEDGLRRTLKHHQVRQTRKKKTERVLKWLQDQDGCMGDRLFKEKSVTKRPVEERVVDEGPVEEKVVVVQARLVKEGVVDVGPVKERVIDEGPVEERVIDEGPVKERVIDEGPVEEKVIDQGPVEERVVDEGPVEERVFDEGPVEERVIDEGPVEERVIDEGPVEERVIDEGPVEEKVIDEGPVEEVLAVVQPRPFEQKVVERDLTKRELSKRESFMRDLSKCLKTLSNSFLKINPQKYKKSNAMKARGRDDSLHDEHYVPPSNSDYLSDEIPFQASKAIISLTCEIQATHATSKSDDQGNGITIQSTSNIDVTTSTEAIPESDDQENGITIQSTSNIDGQKWDKKNFCFFCNKPQSKIWRHMQSQHSNESEVQVIESLSAKKERKNKIMKLRNLGNHIHNCQVLKKNSGTLIVYYRPRGKVDNKEYIPCEYCYGYFVRSELWRHKCSFKPSEKKRVVATSYLLLPAPTGASAALSGVLASSRRDDISQILKSDHLILQLGEQLVSGIGNAKDSESNIRGYLRRMARLLQVMRIQESSPNAHLESFLTPSKYRVCLTAAKSLAGYDENKSQYDTPSLALKVGHTLKKCATILEGQRLEKQDNDGASDAVSFRRLLELNWSDEVSRCVLRTIIKKAMNNTKLFPLTEDIVKLSNKLKQEASKCVSAMNSAGPNDDILSLYKTLNEVTLAAIILFNRKRAGEVSKMNMSHYQTKQAGSGQKLINDSLSPLEQELSKSLQKFEIIGKRGRVVPVLLTRKMAQAVDTLVKYRKKIVIPKDNKFLFPTPSHGGLGHIRGTDALRKWSLEIQAEMPHLLRSTRLRKQIATVSQIANLQENELDLLAGFLGHDIRVHRNFYRLPNEALQVARISKLLIAAQDGNVQIMGKTLEDIEVTPDDEVGGTEYSSEFQVEEGTDLEDAEPGPSQADYDMLDEDLESDSESDKVKSLKKQKRKKVKISERPCARKAWSADEKAAVKRHFSKYYYINELPGKAAIEAAMQIEKALINRTWRNVKDHIRTVRKI